MEVWPIFGLRFRPLPSTFWGMSKNKSCSTLCAEVLHGGLEIFRPPKLLWAPTLCRRMGHYLADLRQLKYSSCRPKHDGMLGYEFGYRLIVDRISHIARYPGSLGLDRWMVLSLL
ncbi:unnamed protein product [Prunus armeniaca]